LYFYISINMIFVTIFLLFIILFYKKIIFLAPPSVPILGHSLITLKIPPEVALKKAIEFHSLYGNVIGAYLGTKTVVFLVDPKDVEIILSSSVHIDKSEDYQ